MKKKTNELIGPALDYAAARAQGMRPSMFIVKQSGDLALEHRYSRLWAKGGPIIEREGIGLIQPGSTLCGEWGASYHHPDFMDGTGPTPLVAAMRCYVLKKLGDEVDIPEELIN